ncbi:MAG: MOSC domain-containing protein YiiM [Myxococcota bacterium]|jgi:MOSC domain-containing protein YiiM
MQQLPLPTPNLTAHLSLEVLTRHFADLPPAPRDHGKVTLLLARAVDSSRTLYDRVVLTSEGGMPGDRWSDKTPIKPNAQLAVMSHRVATLIGNGQPLALFGDNLAIDLDLSTASLPIGSRVRIGEALLEVTPMPHNGCSKYAARFGMDALKFISAPDQKPLRLRGLYLRVIETGVVWLGADVVVCSRPQ